MKCRILVIDDDIEILDLVKILLKMEDFEVITSTSGLEGLELLKNNSYSMIILDLGLPDIDGEQLCKLIRRQYNTPILILSAKESATNKVLCFEYGADDYLTKPFENIELVARIKAIMRRCCPEPEISENEKGEIHYKDLVINIHERSVTKNSKPIDMTPKEYELLLYFIRNIGQTLTRDNIIKELWGKDVLYKFSRSLDVHVQHLRQKIEDNPRNPSFIKTVSGVGYKIES